MFNHMLAILVGILQFWAITALGVTFLVLGLLAFHGAIDSACYFVLHRKHSHAVHHTV